MTATTHRLPDPGSLRAAFRDLHGRRVHGFALLLTLGDRARAAQLSAEALAAGSAEVDQLRHPERAAAWLRARVTRVVERSPFGGTPSATAEDRRAVLDALGLTEAGQAGLAALPLADRAAFIAEAIEGFGSLDVITIAGIGGGRLAQRRAHARRAFAMAAAGPAAEDAGDEPTAEDAGDEPTTLGALAVVDVGRASEPPIRVPSTADEQDDVASPMHAGRAALSLAAVTVIASGAIVGAWRLWPAGEPPERPTPQRNIGEGVLGGAGGGTADPGPKSGFLAGSPSPTTTAAPSPSPDGTADSPGQPQPPPPAPPLPPPPGPTPTPAATPTAQPTPTASPTAQPSPSPTASPEPSPIPTVPISPPMP